MEQDHEKLERKFVCAKCVGEAYLSKCIDNQNQIHKCSYCNKLQPSITLEDFSDHIEAAFETHYSRTSSEPDFYQSMMLRDEEFNYDWERKGETTLYAISSAATISEEIAQDVQAILEDRYADFEAAQMGEETEFSEDAHYEEIMPKDDHWQEKWTRFEKLIKTQSRFFNRIAAADLGEMFNRVNEMQTSDGRSLIETVGPDSKMTHLFRARVFQSVAKLEDAMKRPDLELSAPPVSAAASGRMNAKGISVFYGATAPEVALAEVRPPVGSKVLLAKFDIVRPLKLLDLVALGDVHEHGSVFDQEYAYRLGRMMFLRTLSHRMSRPVLPDDQDMEYLSTQAIADYLSSAAEVPLDGILFPSVQVGGSGVNAVLFHKASRCDELEIPAGTKLDAQTYQMSEDGPEYDYTVYEAVPAPKKPIESDAKATKARLLDLATFDWDAINDSDDRDKTLKIDTSSLCVYDVNAVQIKANSYSVQRHRREIHDFDF
jgi:hypothetical protein